MIKRLFVAWFLADTPGGERPLLLYAREIGDDDKALEIARAVYEVGQEVAINHGIHRTVHVSTFTAYIAMLSSCNRAERKEQ